MFRPMRRKKQELSPSQCIAILEKGTYGVLAVSGKDGYPYAVPMSYVYDNGKIIFHSAKNGHKIDAIQKINRVSFCVTELNQIMPAEYTTYFRSVIVFGKLRILTDEAEKMDGIEKLAKKYAPDESAESRKKEIQSGWNALCVLELAVEHMTGKQAIELVQEEKKAIELI